MRPRDGAAARFLAAGIVAASCAGAFEISRADAQRLLDGDVIVTLEPGEAAKQGRINAAIWIGAEAPAVWAVMTDCSQALLFVPGMKRCELLERAADGTWEVIEHEVKYSALLPRTRYVFQASYRTYERIDFRHLQGDFARNEGSWELEPVIEGEGVFVKYSVFVEPPRFIPGWLLRSSLEESLPELMRSLRKRVLSLPAR